MRTVELFFAQSPGKWILISILATRRVPSGSSHHKYPIFTPSFPSLLPISLFASTLSAQEFAGSETYVSPIDQSTIISSLWILCGQIPSLIWIANFGQIVQENRSFRASSHSVGCPIGHAIRIIPYAIWNNGEEYSSGSWESTFLHDETYVLSARYKWALGEESSSVMLWLCCFCFKIVCRRMRTKICFARWERLTIILSVYVWRLFFALCNQQHGLFLIAYHSYHYAIHHSGLLLKWTFWRRSLNSRKTASKHRILRLRQR